MQRLRQNIVCRVICEHTLIFTCTIIGTADIKTELVCGASSEIR